MNIEELKIGSKYSGYLQIRNVSLRETRAGDPYMFINAGKISGDIMVKIWSINKKLAEVLVDGSVGGFLKLENLLVGEYNGNKELVSRGGGDVSYLTRKEMESLEDFDISDYSIGAPFSLEEMLSKIERVIDEDISNPEVKKLVKTLVDKHKDLFVRQPAAISIHHNYEEGLLFHTYNMLRVGRSLVKYYPFVNKSLLLAGIILHDMGKVVEYDKDQESGGYSYSIKGNLLGHISMMSAEIAKVGEELNISEEVITNLQHLVLSHHGKLEWGSPILPKTPEAVLLHYIDNLDSKMEQVRSELITMEKGQTSQRIFGLGNVELYYPDVEEIKEKNSDSQDFYVQNIFDDLKI